MSWPQLLNQSWLFGVQRGHRKPEQLMDGMLFYIINFYWSIVDLQCCVSSCCTAKWISYTYTHGWGEGQFICWVLLFSCLSLGKVYPMGTLTPFAFLWFPASPGRFWWRQRLQGPMQPMYTYSGPSVSGDTVHRSIAVMVEARQVIEVWEWASDTVEWSGIVHKWLNTVGVRKFSFNNTIF